MLNSNSDYDYDYDLGNGTFFEDMYDMRKNDSRYTNSFKNKGKGKPRNNYSRISSLGNSLSCAGSRPSAGVECKRRLANKLISNQVSFYKEIDTKTIIPVSNVYRKSIARTVVPLEIRTHKNNQMHNENDSDMTNKDAPILSKYHIQRAEAEKMIKLKVLKTQPRIANIKDINQRLFIGNKNSANRTILKKHNITHVIDLTNDGCDKYEYRCEINPIKVYRISFKDSRVISHRSFEHILERALNFIDSVIDTNKSNILIACDSGVNRSVSVVIGYAMKRCGITFNDALGVIEKSKNDDQWFNLTNLRLMRLLKNIRPCEKPEKTEKSMDDIINNFASNKDNDELLDSIVEYLLLNIFDSTSGPEPGDKDKLFIKGVLKVFQHAGVNFERFRSIIDNAYC